MAEAILTEEEIDTLLDGVTNGEVDVEGSPDPGAVSVFDFTRQHDIIISRLPRLETVIGEFTKATQQTLLSVYKQDVEVQLAYLHTRKFSEFRKSLSNPSNLNLLNVSPFDQQGLIIPDAKLLYILVDQYFGGTGELAGRVETNMFSPIELKMSEQFIGHILNQWRIAWDNVTPMVLTSTGREDNPDVLQFLGANDVILQAVFQVGFHGNFGEFQIAFPYSILESLRETLGPDVSTLNVIEDMKWRDAIVQEISTAQVSVSSSIDNLTITLKELLELSPGDVVPIEMPESVCLFVEGLPVFEGRLGAFNGLHAIEIERGYSHTRSVRTTTTYLQ